MTTTLMPNPKMQFFSVAGLPLVGGKVYTYAARTNNPKVTYTDAAGTVPQANPIQLNVRGEPASPIFWSGAYRVEIRDALNNVVYTVDDFNTDPAGLWGLPTELNAGDGANRIGFVQAGDGAQVRDLLEKGRESVSVDDYFIAGEADYSTAFAKALAVSDEVRGVPNKVYMVSASVTIPSGKRLVGNGATIRGGAGVILFRTPNDNVQVLGWNIEAGGALYAFLNTGKRNAFFQNRFSGNVGHFILDSGGAYTKVYDNFFHGNGVDRIVTSVVMENTTHFSVSNNTFVDIENWCVQTRNAHHGAINGNVCHGTEYLAYADAAAGQTVFNFVLSNPCHLAGVQVNGLPVDSGITFAPTIPAAVPTKNWQVSFAAPPGVGKTVKLIAFRSAENIQINNGSTDITVTANSCTGSGDSGIIVAGGSAFVTITGNTVQNISYAGISVEGGSEGCVIVANTTRDCSKVTNAATYSSGILIGGNNNLVQGNLILNTAVPNPQKYGISVNTYGSSAGEIDEDLKIGQNVYMSTSQPYIHNIFIPNEDATLRRQSVRIEEGVRMQYPEQVNLDGAWANAPVATSYFTYTGFGGTIAVRDAVTKLGGAASLKTVAGEYIDIQPLAYATLVNTIVDITFWAINNAGDSYCTAFEEVGGVLFNSPGCAITDTNWKLYRLSFPMTANVNPANFKIRFGANAGSANIQHIQISMVSIP